MEEVGCRIRALRLRQGRTLEQIASICGCTRSLLSKIENGKSTPPLATLMRISQALGVKAAALLSQEAPQTIDFTRGVEITGAKMVMTERGYAFYTYAPQLPDKQMQPFLFTARKGEVLEHKLSHAGEEFIYMLKGCMSYRVAGIEYTLNEGDTLYFDSAQTHSFSPLSDEVKYLGIFTEYSHSSPKTSSPKLPQKSPVKKPKK